MNGQWSRTRAVGRAAKIDAGGTSTADTDWTSDHLKSEPRFSCFGQYELGKL